MLDNLLQADGAGSGIDADKLDGISSDTFVRNDQNGDVNGTLSATIVNAIQGMKVNGADVIDANGDWVGPAILTPQTVLDNLLQADGAGSAIEADFLDGLSSETFVRNDQDATINGSVSATILDASLGVRINGAGVIDAAGNWVGPDPLTAEEIRDKLIQVDGIGSSIDADLIDGLSSEQLLRNDQNVQLNGVLTATALVINDSIGIGTANPQTVLEINGAIKIGSENDCDANHAGTLRYAANLMELCDGTQWQEILTAGGAPPGCTLEALEVDGQNVAHGRILSCRDQDPIRVQIMECGNGTIDGTETCDDGNFTNDDGCNDHCQIECGDGVVGANEACDDGNTIDTDACTASCTIATCGDGSIHEGAEECDGGQDCLADCTKPMCAKTGVCPNLDFVPLTGGVFSMGYDGGAANEKPIHQVTLADFEILRNEVTVAQYKMCLDAGVCTEPKQGEVDLNWGRVDRDQHPMNGINWVQARQFANWVGGDLPSEAQWEYAATSQGSNQLYPWGDDEPDCQRTHNYTCPGTLTATVCTHPTGHSDQGVCDLAGNTWEWVMDNYHATYDGAPVDGSAWCNLAGCLDDGEPRVWKGGDYRFDITRMRSSARGYYGPAVQPAWMGFRVVR